MSFTGRFNEDFNKQSDLPSADLPRDTNEEAAVYRSAAAEDEEEEDE